MDDTWEASTISAIMSRLSEMPTAQIAHTMFFSGRQLADLFIQAGWRSPYKARHYFGSLAMQTQVRRSGKRSRARALTLDEIVDIASAIWALMEQHAFRLAGEQEAWLAGRVFYDRTFNPRFSDVEQIREMCIDFFSSISASDNGIGIDLGSVIAIFDYITSTAETQINLLRVGRWRKPRRKEDPVLHCAEALSVPIPDISDKFGEQATRVVLDVFGQIRGSRADRLLFATDVGGSTLTEKHPLLVADGRVFLGDANALWIALYDRLMLASRKGGANEGRGTYAEDKAAKILASLFGAENVHQHVWEKKGGPEHDAIVCYGDALIVVETKGAAAVPPITTNHALNLQRVRDHAAEPQSPFRGIKQAQRFIEYMEVSKRPLVLRTGKEWRTAQPLPIDPKTFQQFYAITVSLEEYGSLLTDWGLLDLVDKSVGKPWGVNLHTFEQFVWAILRRGWDGRDFLAFLDERISCHGGMATGDELDFAGFWLQHGHMIPFSNPGLTFSGRNWAAIFDELWLERNGQHVVTFTEVTRPAARHGVDRDVAMRRFIAEMTS